VTQQDEASAVVAVLILILIWRGALRRAAGDCDPKNGSSIRGTFHQDLTPVILHNFLYDRKAKAGTVLFAVTHKGVKQFVANRFRDARPVVRNCDGGLTIRCARS